MSARQRKLVLVVSSFAVFFLLAALLKAPAARQMHNWKLLPEPERLTELYFTDHKSLPVRYAAGTQHKVEFTVHNLEYTPTEYSYTIFQASEDGSRHSTLNKGSFKLSQNQYQKESVPIDLTDLGARTSVTVQLSTGETIHYWLNKEEGGA